MSGTWDEVGPEPPGGVWRSPRPAPGPPPPRSALEVIARDAEVRHTGFRWDVLLAALAVASAASLALAFVVVVPFAVAERVPQGAVLALAAPMLVTQVTLPVAVAAWVGRGWARRRRGGVARAAFGRHVQVLGADLAVDARVAMHVRARRQMRLLAVAALGVALAASLTWRGDAAFAALAGLVAAWVVAGVVRLQALGLARAGRAEAAERWFRATWLLWPDDAFLARMRLDRGDPEGALAVLAATAVAPDPAVSGGVVIRELARCQLALGRVDAAFATALDALRYAPTDPASWAVAADAAARGGQLADARLALDQSQTWLVRRPIGAVLAWPHEAERQQALATRLHLGA